MKKLVLVRKGKRKEFTYAPEDYPGWTVVEIGIADDDPRLEPTEERKAKAKIDAMGSAGRFQMLMDEIKDIRARLEKLERGQ